MAALIYLACLLQIAPCFIISGCSKYFNDTGKEETSKEKVEAGNNAEAETNDDASVPKETPNSRGSTPNDPLCTTYLSDDEDSMNRTDGDHAQTNCASVKVLKTPDRARNYAHKLLERLQPEVEAAKKEAAATTAEEDSSSGQPEAAKQPAAKK